MPLTLEEIREELKRVNEVDLLEILEIDSEMLVDRFYDLIEERIDFISPEFEDDDEDN